MKTYFLNYKKDRGSKVSKTNKERKIIYENPQCAIKKKLRFKKQVGYQVV